jgi:hypothetical protein
MAEPRRTVAARPKPASLVIYFARGVRYSRARAKWNRVQASIGRSLEAAWN